jgi:hypothetical protein
VKTTVEYTGFAAAAPTTVYTFNAPAGQPNQRAVIASLSMVDTSAVARTINMRIVPAGETITDDDWCILPKDCALLANQGVWIEDDPEDPTNVLIDGDRVVLDASAADVIAVRLCIGTLP